MACVAQRQPGTQCAGGAAVVAAAAAAEPPSWQLLLELPPDLFIRHVISRLSPHDKAALRQANRCCRRLVNAATSSVVLDVHGPATHAACLEVPAAFPELRHLSIINTHGERGAAPAAGSQPTRAGMAVTAAGLEQQLPELLRGLRHLCSLTYEGPADRRQRGINIMHALETLTAAGDGTVLCQLQPPAAAAAAAAAAAGCKSRADGSSAGCSAGDAPPADCAALDDLPCSAGAPLGDGARSSSGECAAPAHQGQQPQQQPHALECLDLRGGRLPDGLMEVVGRLTGLTSLRLSATTPMNTAPLAALTNITCLHLTVMPPLCSALRPLSSLARLAELHCAALSPARGWGGVLAGLSRCPLRHLRLAFADVGDDDVRQLAAGLTGLTRLNLNCSRHLSARSVAHIARLRSLAALHLEQTGMSLSAADLALLGGACSRLAELAAEFDLRDMPAPAPAPHAAVGHAMAAAAANAASPAGAHQHHPGDVALWMLPCPPAQQGTAGAAALRGAAHRGWPRLRCLVIPGGVSTANIAKLLAGTSPGLTALQLHGLGPNSSEVLGQVSLRAARHLTALSLSGCGALSTACAGMLGASLRGTLTSLTLSDVGASSDALGALLAGLARLGGCSGARPLAHLELCRLPHLDDRVLLHGVAGLHTLRALHLSGCRGCITTPALLACAAQLPRLTRLEVQGCLPEGEEGGLCRAWERAQRVGA